MPEVITLDKWIPVAPERLDPPRRLREGYSFHLTPPQLVTAEKWLPVAPERIHARKRTFPADAILPDPPLAWTVSLDRWAPTYPIRLDPKPMRQAFWDGYFSVDPASLTRKEFPGLEKWQPVTPERIAASGRRQPALYSQTAHEPILGIQLVPLLDKWTMDAAGPQFRRAERQFLFTDGGVGFYGGFAIPVPNGPSTLQMAEVVTHTIQMAEL